MSYYPTERRGGCMESISRCCRQAYVYPIDTRKLLYVGGGILGVIVIAVLWSSFSSSDDGSSAEAFHANTFLKQNPLIVGCNFFPSNLRDLAHNTISAVKFNESLKNDSLFGNATCKSCQTDLPRLESGLVKSQVWSIDVPCNAIYKDAVSLTLEQVDAMTRLIHSYPEDLVLFQSSSDLEVSMKVSQVDSILAVTSGHSIDGRLAVLRSLKTLGVRIMALTASNCSTAWAASCEATNDTGLSDFGKAVVKEMNRLGIVIDLSGASHKTQLDVLSISKAPVIFSNGAAYSLVNHHRNIQDDVLDKLKANKGVVMVTFAQKYITNSSNSSINNVIEHINYIKNKTGVTGVGIGAGFDAAGELYPALLSDVSMFPALFDKIEKTWTNHDDLKKLAGGNFINVLKEVEKYAKDAKSLPVDETYLLQVNSSCYSDYATRANPAIKNETVITTTVSPTTQSVATTTGTAAINTTVATSTTQTTVTPTPSPTTTTPPTPTTTTTTTAPKAS